MKHTIVIYYYYLGRDYFAVRVYFYLKLENTISRKLAKTFSAAYWVKIGQFLVEKFKIWLFLKETLDTLKAGKYFSRVKKFGFFLSAISNYKLAVWLSLVPL